MPRRRREADNFDQRLGMEIITDAKPDDLWIAWCSCLADHLRFPFKANVSFSVQPLCGLATLWKCRVAGE